MNEKSQTYKSSATKRWNAVNAAATLTHATTYIEPKAKTNTEKARRFKSVLSGECLRETTIGDHREKTSEFSNLYVLCSCLYGMKLRKSIIVSDIKSFIPKWLVTEMMLQANNHRIYWLAFFCNFMIFQHNSNKKKKKNTSRNLLISVLWFNMLMILTWLKLLV